MTDQQGVPVEWLGRFSGRVEEYRRFRPSYPAAAIDAIIGLDGGGVGGSGGSEVRLPRVADVGAGTGIASRLFASRGCAVVAVEPNGEMRGAGEAERTPGVEWVSGRGEATGLDDHGVDVVVVAQAFHWMDHPRALAEFRRVIDPGSAWRRLAVMWNEHDRSNRATRAYRALIERHAVDQKRSPSFSGETDVPAEPAGFRPIRRLEFANAQHLTLEGLIGRAFSASYMPREGPARGDAESDLRALHAEHAEGETVRLALRTVLLMTEVVG